VDPTKWDAKMWGFEGERWNIVEEEDLQRKNCGVFLIEEACEGDLRKKCV